MKTKLTAKQQIRQVLRELHEMARLEASCTNNKTARTVWSEVAAWAEGCARERKIDLSNNAADRIARQKEIFP